MKMTDADERALAAIEDAIRTSSYGAFAPGRTALIEARDHIRARLAADQQKGGGCNCEVSAGLAAFHKDDCRAMAPQPSIPAPAQQDGKASGGEVVLPKLKVTDPSDSRAERNWTFGYNAALADVMCLNQRNPPHADQETQG